VSHSSAWQISVWVALPYLALGIFVVGHVWRWRYDQFGWTSRSTQLQERKLLKWGSPIFHYGTFAAIAGHVIGVLIPERWTRAIGIPESAYINLFGPGYDYRTTVAPWFRGLFSGSPDVSAITGAPIVYQVHAASAWLIWALWPFSRLVHAWSAPLWYLWRPYIVYRSRRAARPAEPGTSGRRWRRIGVPY